MSRQVQKRVFAWDETLNGGAGDWKATPDVDQRFVYDEWNVVLVLDGTDDNAITHKYTWGLDLSGLAGQGAAGFSPRGSSDGATAGIHGAGGIGGLLAVEAPQSEGDPLRHWYFYDGNGNVGQLVSYDATGPTVGTTPAAKYEYDPYGQLIAQTDTVGNPFRFSTKWFDTTTGLGYWGYRHYSPRLGRWMSRDPIQEAGGKNVCSFVKNRAVNTYDPHGLRVGFPCGHPSLPPCPPPPPTLPDAGQCCRDAKARGDHISGGRPSAGGVICCDGKKVACAWVNHTGDANRDVGVDIVIDCITEHEEDHFDDVRCWPGCSYRPQWRWFKDPNKEECKAYNVELACLKRRRKDCSNAPNSTVCEQEVDRWIKDREKTQIPRIPGCKVTK